MSLKNKVNKSLIIGLTVSSVFVSLHSIHALNEDAIKDTVKADNKIELNIDEKEKQKQEINTLQQEIVVSSGLNIRKEASKDSEIIGCLRENDIVTVLETKENWSKIKVSEQEEGWVNNKYTDNEKAKVNTNRLNLRMGPSTENEILDVLDRNTNLEVLHVLEVQNKGQESKETWYEVKVLDSKSLDKTKAEESIQNVKDEKIGFVHGSYILTQSKEAKLQKQSKNDSNTKQVTKKQTKKHVTKQIVKESNKVVTDNKVVKHNKVVSSSNLSGKTVTVNATAYSGDSITSTGTVPKWGTIAVDPSVIPYGTKVYIPMFDKVFTAEDCGGAIKGNKIDIFMNSEQQMDNFGRRNIQIKILG